MNCPKYDSKTTIGLDLCTTCMNKLVQFLKNEINVLEKE